jgi:hypothetical protein
MKDVKKYWPFLALAALAVVLFFVGKNNAKRLNQ